MAKKRGSDPRFFFLKKSNFTIIDYMETFKNSTLDPYYKRRRKKKKNEENQIFKLTLSIEFLFLKLYIGITTKTQDIVV